MGSRKKLEEIKEGMQHEHDEEHEGEHEEEHDEEHSEDHHEEEYDEHVLLSVQNAKLICENLTKSISDIDSQNADIY